MAASQDATELRNRKKHKLFGCVQNYTIIASAKSRSVVKVPFLDLKVLRSPQPITEFTHSMMEGTESVSLVFWKPREVRTGFGLWRRIFHAGTS